GTRSTQSQYETYLLNTVCACVLLSRRFTCVARTAGSVSVLLAATPQRVSSGALFVNMKLKALANSYAVSLYCVAAGVLVVPSSVRNRNDGACSAAWISRSIPWGGPPSAVLAVASV